MEMLKSTQGARRRPFRTAVIALSSAAVGALAVGMAPVEAQNPPNATPPVARISRPYGRATRTWWKRSCPPWSASRPSAR